MNTEFEEFIKAIKLTSKQREDAQKKYDGVCKKLHEHYYPELDYNGNTRFLIGSYGKKTHIQPARDVDVIFIMPSEKFVEYDDNQSNCQSQLLQTIRTIMHEKYPNTPIKAFGKVVILEFSDPQHDIEVQPAWENEDNTFTIPNSENSGSWEIVNPRSEIKEIKDSDELTGKTKDLIRIIKKWSEQSTVLVKSYDIEKHVLGFFLVNTTDTDYSILVRDFFQYFHDVVSDEKLKSHLSTALSRANKACEFEDDSKFDKAKQEWGKIFGDKFPTQATKDYIITDPEISNLTQKYPSSEEQFIDRDFNFGISINPAYEFEIDGYFTKAKGFRPGWLGGFIGNHSLFRLLKSIKIKFQIRKNSISQPYDLYWKVRNFGEEAKSDKGLRGEITKDFGREEKEESTRYYGIHMVECYVIKNGKCVAIGRTLVPIGNETE